MTTDTTFRFGGEYNRSYFLNGLIDDVRVYNRSLSAQEVKELYVSTSQWQTGDCLDSSGTYHPLTRRYKDLDDDGYSDGTMLMQCGQPTNYKLAVNLTAIAGDCDDTNDQLNDATIRRSDDDGDTFSDGASTGGCADPGATRWLPSQLTG